MTPLDWLFIVLEDAFWSAIAATGFAVLFNVPPRALWGCALAGAIGHALRTVMVEMAGLSVEFGTLVGAASVGFIGVQLARRLRAPSLIFTVPAAIPMVPGVFAYTAMLNFLVLASSTPEAGSTLLVDAMTNLIRATLVLGAIAIGITLPQLLFRRARPIV
ncbi:MAG: threonine/serine exporter family protein [Chloroflexota bacterium]